MEVVEEFVEGYSRNTIPDENETIYDNFEFSVEKITSIVIYKRPPEDCPLNRGNWLLDVRFNDGHIICIKLPLEMTIEQIDRYFKPLIDDFETFKKSRMN